ncbi:GspH/FimT family pseudopilin [Thiococcus pfennigii]|uniref:GspH/FimT family pseudopilin n=1 Tax=Thiococcus pfennigii TaxID=1057 RepID=UPI0023EE419B|nr:GspH/FimT family pseudopilin [Thiococcus pfennigii]MBK1731985.1 hypothetical protein [Thiococcus pfennigii]
MTTRLANPAEHQAPPRPTAGSTARRPRHAGVTLIELIMTLALAGILMALAVPSFQSVIANNRSTAQANAIVTALSLARSEAIKRGGQVSVCPSADPEAASPVCRDGTDWSDGWIVVTDSAASDATAPVIGTVLRVWSAPTGIATFTGPNWVRYRGGGDASLSAAIEFEIEPSGCSGQQGRTITVGLVGHATIAKKDCESGDE